MILSVTYECRNVNTLVIIRGPLLKCITIIDYYYLKGRDRGGETERSFILQFAPHLGCCGFSTESFLFLPLGAAAGLGPPCPAVPGDKQGAARNASASGTGLAHYSTVIPQVIDWVDGVTHAFMLFRC